MQRKTTRGAVRFLACRKRMLIAYVEYVQENG